ncbi:MULTISPECIES: CE1759 family FMN reductase [unclassified Micromonospora]|uniref:CE1759 family FMN reductase n=1 Tax=unclassified Micromonospora TaxID=2617518 RepID=UPI001B38444B|nr:MULTISPECIES: CE1759 family FMN reductase [unclassified Micromonospora]MBQ1045232.1 NAD(P)H-dependent oxidoreductase [Micromonospora sp. C72]MBQ1058137.1 NAD(P)H-dependent oxidoreductase [Micromonospora sp. C32]
MTRRTLAVVSAGLAQPSSTRLLADQLAAAARDELGGRGATVELRTVELREHAHDVVNHLLTGFAPAALRQTLDAVAAADALIAVTPIFNASYNGLFKSFFDVIDRDTLAGKPVLIGATGGTARHSLALEHAVRPMFTYLRAATLPTAVFAAPEDWAGDDGDSALRSRIRRAAAELAEQVGRRPPATGPADPFALTTDFADLLAGRDPS